MASSVSFSGMASGIDTDSLIQATISSKRELRISPLEDKISEAEDESSAITSLKEKLISLKNKLSKFNALSGGAITKEALSSDETILSAVASNVSSQGMYDITVNSLAKRGTFTIGTTYSSQTDKIADDATSTQIINITVGTGDDEKSFDIEIDDTTTLADIVDKINTAGLGCEATIVNIGTSISPSYTLMVTSLNEGISKGQISVTTSSDNANIQNLINNGTLTQAQNAVFSIKGLASNIERDSNIVANILPGVTFTLQSVGSATISITNGLDSTQTNVQDIVDSINDIFSFVSENNTVERRENGENVTNVFASLSKTKIDDNVITAIKSTITSSRYTQGAEVRIFADFGITTNSQDGTLNFDTEKFEEAFAKDPNAINKILTQFSDTLSATGGTIDQYTRYNGLLDVVINNNTKQISDYNDRIATYESMLSKEEDNLRAMYARFESLMSELQNSAGSLTSMLGTNNS